MKNPHNINTGDVVTVSAQGLKVTGKVVYVSYYETEGYDIEMTEANVRGNYSHWKQWADGGKIIEVNGKTV